MSQITNQFLFTMPSLTIKGNDTVSAANPLNLTVAQVNAILPVFTSTLNGLTPFSGGGSSNFLRADGTWAIPAASTTSNVNTTQVSTNASFFPLFVASSTNSTQAVDLGTGLTFNPSTNVLSTTTFAGALTGTASGNSTITPANHAVAISSATNALSTAAPSATSGVPLISQGSSADPIFGTVAIAGGGTGAVTKAAAFDALSPMSTGGDLIYGGSLGTGTRLANGSAGQVLQSQGTTLAPTWATIGSGTVTSVALSLPSFITVSGSPVTTSGTLTGTLATQTAGTFFAGPTSGAAAAPTFRALQARTQQTFITGSGTYTTPAGVLYIEVTILGGGGAGGGAPTTGVGQVSVGGGGGAGATVIKTISAPSATYNYVVGAGGTANSGAAGNAGANTTFGSSLLTANGGPGGSSSTAGTLVNTGGTGTAAGTGGDVNIPGGPGQAASGINGQFVLSGSGGYSTLGSGGQSQVSSSAGAAGYVYGGGGSGGTLASSTSAVAGGAGAVGIIIVKEFYQ